MEKIKSCVFFAVLVILCNLFLAACFALPEEPPAVLPPRFTPPEPREIWTTPASRGDVRAYIQAQAQYVLAREVSLSFDETGIPIRNIYAQVGDVVSAGDIIASLGIEGVDEVLEVYVSRRNALNLQLSQLAQRRHLAVSLAVSAGIPIDDSGYITEERVLQAELSVISRQIARLQEYVFVGYLISPMDGVVTFTTRFIEGMTSSAGSRVAVVSDPVASAFIMRYFRALPYMIIGNQFSATFRDSTFMLEVVCPEEYGFYGRPEWAGAAFLMFAEHPHPIIDHGFGNLHIIFDAADDVIYIPTELLHEAGERTFVYILENGLRQVRDVVVGVRGNYTVEIISGLEEGEEVIR